MVNAWVQASEAILCRYTGSRLSPDLLPLRLHDALTLYFPASDIEQLVKMVDAARDARLMDGGMTAGVRLGNGRSLATPPVPIASFEV